MKAIIATVIGVLAIIMTIVFVNPIADYIASFIDKNPSLVILEKNAYTKDEEYLYVQPTDDFVPYSFQDLINIYYSTINNGWDRFTFYCPSEYENCLLDVEEISSNELILTHMNNYVHPYNSFTNVYTSISESGEINLEINYLYDDAKIKQIDEKVDELIASLIKDDMSDYDKIKTVHDYIINNANYDVERNEDGDSQYDSYGAYGPLFQGYATCNGYTDLMAVFLTKMGYNNYKVATTPEEISYSATGHIWNAVYLDGEWLHIDLTWDDPVSDTNEEYLFHTYFLVTTQEMKKADEGETVIEEHNFDKLFYLEFNNEEEKIISLVDENYSKNKSYAYVKINNSKAPTNREDILDIMYTNLDDHQSSFYFICTYSNCINDVDSIISDSLTLIHLKNYLHPYNNFIDMSVSTINNQININVTFLYSDEEIERINKEVKKVIEQKISPVITAREQVKIIHDYIINKAEYSDTHQFRNVASGPLFNGYANCEGYTDLMAIFLSELGINNYKIATTSDRISYESSGHIWNAAFVGGSWLHLDLTWDDPVGGEEAEDYFLIDTKTLVANDTKAINNQEHNFNLLYYMEFF